MTYPSFKIFSTFFGLVYAIVFYMEWALFRYYPETRAFHITQHRQDGPAILWYGWLAVAAIVSAALAFAVPRRMAERVPNEVVWGMQIALVVIMFIYEKQWFF
jgi:glucan phosphoethanolaminetransferase (alkaline phosphatase superfamily)